MVTIRVIQGLGNQLFQYALGIIFKIKNPNANIFYDVRELENSASRNKFNFEDCFDAKVNIITKENSIDTLKLDKWHYINKKIHNRLFWPYNVVYYENGFNYILEPLGINIDCRFIDIIRNFHFDNNSKYYFDGFWENIEYFQNYFFQLKKLLLFKKNRYDFDSVNEIIDNYDSIFVHIRRTDYITDSSIKKYPHPYYLVCPIQYYKDAIDIMNKKFNRPYYLFFSDDPEYCEKEFAYLKNKIVITNNKNYEDLQLMTLCKHGILANSTFSFWGAFLNNNQGTFIAPSIHYLIINRCNYYIKNFFRIPNWIYMDSNRYIKCVL